MLSALPRTEGALSWFLPMAHTQGLLQALRKEQITRRPRVEDTLAQCGPLPELSSPAENHTSTQCPQVGGENDIPITP